MEFEFNKLKTIKITAITAFYVHFDNLQFYNSVIAVLLLKNIYFVLWIRLNKIQIKKKMLTYQKKALKASTSINTEKPSEMHFTLCQ